jgi:hypothetical protein
VPVGDLLDAQRPADERDRRWPWSSSARPRGGEHVRGTSLDELFEPGLRCVVDRRDQQAADPRLLEQVEVAPLAAGLALVPEDRRQQGLVMELNVERNATLPRRWSLSRLGLLTGAAERRSARLWLDRLRVKAGRTAASWAHTLRAADPAQAGGAAGARCERGRRARLG